MLSPTRDTRTKEEEDAATAEKNTERGIGEEEEEDDEEDDDNRGVLEEDDEELDEERGALDDDDARELELDELELELRNDPVAGGRTISFDGAPELNDDGENTHTSSEWRIRNTNPPTTTTVNAAIATLTQKRLFWAFTSARVLVEMINLYLPRRFIFSQ